MLKNLLFLLTLVLFQSGNGQEIYQEDFMEDGVRLLYPHFDLQIVGFFPDEVERVMEDEYWKYSYYGDSSLAGLLWWDEYDYPAGLVIKNDTFRMSEHLDSYITGKLFLINPTDSSDEFRFSIAYEYSTYEVVDAGKVSASDDYEFIQWEDFSPFVELKDSSKYYYSIPSTQSDYWEIIRERYGLRDTSLVLPGEYPTYVQFVKNSKLFSQRITNLIIRLERNQVDGHKETWYIFVWYNDSC